MGEPESNRILEAIMNLKSEMKQDMKQMRESVEGKIDGVKKEVQKMETRLENQDTRIILMEKEVRKRNIIIYGIEEKMEENWKTLKEIIIAFLKNTMEVETKLEEIDEFYRMGKKVPNKNRPIMLKFITYWKKQEIIRSTGKLKGTKIFLDQDLTAKEVEEKKKLIPTMVHFRKNGHHAVMRGSHLYVNGKLHREGNQYIPPTNAQAMEWSSTGNSKDTPSKRQMSPSNGRTEKDNQRKKTKLFTTHQRTSSQGQITLDKVGVTKNKVDAGGSNTPTLPSVNITRNNSYECVVRSEDENKNK